MTEVADVLVDSQMIEGDPDGSVESSRVAPGGEFRSSQ